jgi:hypothetical protein
MRQITIKTKFSWKESTWKFEKKITISFSEWENWYWD